MWCVYISNTKPLFFNRSYTSGSKLYKRARRAIRTNEFNKPTNKKNNVLYVYLQEQQQHISCTRVVWKFVWYSYQINKFTTGIIELSTGGTNSLGGNQRTENPTILNSSEGNTTIIILLSSLNTIGELNQFIEFIQDAYNKASNKRYYNCFGFYLYSYLWNRYKGIMCSTNSNRKDHRSGWSNPRSGSRNNKISGNYRSGYRNPRSDIWIQLNERNLCLNDMEEQELRTMEKSNTIVYVNDYHNLQSTSSNWSFTQQGVGRRGRFW